MNKERIEEILAQHQLWLQGRTTGGCANLRGADLRGADLRCADLQGADLRCAKLQGADLQGANLRCAKLRGADLQGANLQCANLQGADLRCANLQCADLWGANLRGADLWGANLRGADIDYAAWPLWCGSLNVTIDERIAKQLIYHALAVALPHMPKRAITKTLIRWANEFHRVGEVPELEVEE